MHQYSAFWPQGRRWSRVEIKKKLGLALAAYAGLAALAWTTLSDDAVPVAGWNIRIRTVTLMVLGLFAFRSLMYFWRTQIEKRDGA